MQPGLARPATEGKEAVGGSSELARLSQFGAYAPRVTPPIDVTGTSREATTAAVAALGKDAAGRGLAGGLPTK
ncbi:MAG: hypothetical protein ACRDZX_14265 [Acidimicrobiales bacterium]